MLFFFFFNYLTLFKFPIENAFQHIFKCRQSVCVQVCVCALWSELSLVLEQWHRKPVVFSARYANALSRAE